ncbi:MAG: hypothetical protein AAF589_02935, partial [Planctomycetota bacterium]
MSATSLNFVRGATLALLVVLSASAQASTTTLLDIGFESSEGYSTVFGGTGDLFGQVPSAAAPNGEWETDGPDEAIATVQTGTVLTGSQAVEVTTPGFSSPFSSQFWGIPTSTPDPIVTIEWDMRVEPPVSPPIPGQFGPVFGVVANDISGAPFPELGSLGVDVNTGELLIQLSGSGAFDVIPAAGGGFVTAPAGWNRYGIVLNFLTQEYTYSLNGVEL